MPRTPVLLAVVLLAACDAGSGLVATPDLAMGGPTIDPNAQPLVFSVFGDCRPGNEDDTANYPTAVATNIFKLAAEKSPSFMVGTGDYMFASNQGAVTAQVALLAQAESAFGKPIYHAMGNHECTGATASNCPNGNETANVRAFMSQMIPAGTKTPYYRVDVETRHGKAKFLFIAGNGWSAAQSTWLEEQLADPTTYTFAIRHVPPSASAPGVTESEKLILDAPKPITLELLGHFHEYQRVDPMHVISGNGGAPSRAGEVVGFGFLLIEEQADGTLAGTEYDQTTGNAIDTWRITADGKDAS